MEGLGCCCSYNTQEHNTITNNTTVLLLKLYSCKNDGKSQLSFPSVLTCRCLLVLLVLDWAGSWVARRTPVLWGPTLLGLACRRGRRLGVLRVGVQGGAWVGILLRHWPLRHCDTGISLEQHP